jgi:predicted acyl esterase
MATSKTSEPTYKVVMEKDVAMRTRDGVTLRADVYRPDASGKFPVLVVRTPYDKSAGMAATEKDYFPPRGYVVVMQDTRGRHASGGEFTPFVNEGRDGYDAIEWPPACRGRMARSARWGSRTWGWCSTSPLPSARRI